MVKKNETMKKWKTINEVKEKLMRSLVEGKEYKSDEQIGRAKNVKGYQDTTPIINEYETIYTKTKTKHTMPCIQARVCI